MLPKNVFEKIQDLCKKIIQIEDKYYDLEHDLEEAHSDQIDLTTEEDLKKEIANILGITDPYIAENISSGLCLLLRNNLLSLDNFTFIVEHRNFNLWFVSTFLFLDRGSILNQINFDAIIRSLKNRPDMVSCFQKRLELVCELIFCDDDDEEITESNECCTQGVFNIVINDSYEDPSMFWLLKFIDNLDENFEIVRFICLNHTLWTKERVDALREIFTALGLDKPENYKQDRAIFAMFDTYNIHRFDLTMLKQLDFLAKIYSHCPGPERKKYNMWIIDNWNTIITDSEYRTKLISAIVREFLQQDVVKRLPKLPNVLPTSVLPCPSRPDPIKPTTIPWKIFSLPLLPTFGSIPDNLPPSNSALQLTSKSFVDTPQAFFHQSIVIEKRPLSSSCSTQSTSLCSPPAKMKRTTESQVSPSSFNANIPSNDTRIASATCEVEEPAVAATAVPSFF